MSDYHNPLSVFIPHDFQHHNDFPTEVVAQRFQAYRDIAKDLISYLRQYASVQEEIIRQQVRLQQAVGAPGQPALPSNSSKSDKHPSLKSDKIVSDDDALSAINQFFLPIGNGSIQDIPTILTRFHQQNIQNGTKTLKDINLVIIPKLEDLRKDLLVKIKEIRNLQNDFKNTLSKEMAETKHLMNSFNHAIDVANHLEIPSMTTLHHDGGEQDLSKKDPYLVKLKLERQLKRQLAEESYLYEAFKNLQVSSEKLESIVVLEIQNYMGMFLHLVENESSSVLKFLVPNFSEGFLAKEPNTEWESFIARNLPKASSISNNVTGGKFVDLNFPTRRIRDLSIPHYDSIINVAIKEGSLERRSKFLKSYSSGWYVLTCSYLHEFKSSDRKKDHTPVMSLSLNHCLVSEHSKNDGKALGSYKFVLYSKLQNSLMNRGHNWSFKCDNYPTMIEWYNDIKTLTSLALPSARAKAMSKKLTANNTLERNVSSGSSLMSTHTGLKTLRSNTTSSRFQNKFSPKQATHTIRSSGMSQVSNHSGSTNQRLSSAFAQKHNQSPRISNLINSDGTAVPPPENDHTNADTNGDIAVRIDHDNEATNDGGQAPSQTGFSAGVVTTPQQTIPHNYQYYLNQVPSQPQQFYDPVLQQFFTINAIPAAQVEPPHANPQPQHTMTSQPQGAVQPMPQYFPSSPLGQPQMYMPGLPNLTNQLVPTSPQVPAGQIITVKGENGQLYNQYVPHFPAHMNDGKQGSAPYPVQLGHSFVSSRQNSTISRRSTSSVAREEQTTNETLEEATSKLNVGGS